MGAHRQAQAPRARQKGGEMDEVKGESLGVRIRRFTAPDDWSGGRALDEQLAVEEPLEIRMEGRSVAVTLRTPGHDLDLAAGFLFTEGVIDGPDDIEAMAVLDAPGADRGNVVHVRLAAGVPALRRGLADRAIFANSSCGICGKSAIDRIFQRCSPLPPRPTPPVALLLSLPDRLRAAQATFDRTGGLHAAGLFTEDGTLEVIREDVGRHNAVDKVIGDRLRADRLQLHGHILVLSGRIGMEIVQKAIAAGIPVIVAVGAPTSLAVELARRAGLALIGFVREGRLNRYDLPDD